VEEFGMSLQQNKNALFGKAPLPSKAESKPASPSPVSASGQVKASAAPKSTISAELKTRKLNEAKESEDRAERFLKTSVCFIFHALVYFVKIFQWSPDHVAAASALDAAGTAYKVIEEYDLAIKAYLRVLPSSMITS
jgi:hypothetical protein